MDASPVDSYRLELEYPVEPRFRYGWGLPAHPEMNELISRGEDRYSSLLHGFNRYRAALGEIPQVTSVESEPFWRSSYFEGLDVVALYGLLAERDPRTYVEIGSGFSTRLARRVVNDQGLRTRIVSVDPAPRSAVNNLADESIAEPLERLDLSLLTGLTSEDVLFLDGSHRAFMNSDTTAFFLEVVPSLAAGVLVHVHDIFLPWDYPPHWVDRWYSEQYLLAAWLLAGDRLNIVMPSFYVSLRPSLHHILDPVFDQFIWSGMATNGSSFWFETVG